MDGGLLFSKYIHKLHFLFWLFFCISLFFFLINLMSSTINKSWQSCCYWINMRGDTDPHYFAGLH